MREVEAWSEIAPIHRPGKPQTSCGHPYFLRTAREKEDVMRRAREIRPSSADGPLRISADICGTLVGDGPHLRNTVCDLTLPPNSMTFGVPG
jgi:hypothetical protein